MCVLCLILHVRDGGALRHLGHIANLWELPIAIGLLRMCLLLIIVSSIFRYFLYDLKLSFFFRLFVADPHFFEEPDTIYCIPLSGNV